MDSIIKSLFKHTPLTNVNKLFKKKDLFIVVPIAIIIFSFIIYGIAIWTSLFIIVYENGFSFYGVLDIAAGQWTEFISSYTPQWLKSWSDWPSIILNLLWTTFIGFLPIILVLIWGTIIIIRAAAYLLGFIGHFFLILKKWILDQ